MIHFFVWVAANGQNMYVLLCQIVSVKLSTVNTQNGSLLFYRSIFTVRFINATFGERSVGF